VFRRLIAAVLVSGVLILLYGHGFHGIRLWH
jgi:hypothetical protein